jgi:hypothetical protein
MTGHRSITLHRLSAASRLVAVALFCANLAACANSGNTDGVAYRQSRMTEEQSVRAWRACRDQGFQLADQAHDEASPARYLASARLTFGRCEEELIADATPLVHEERLRAHAVAIQNLVKGGDVSEARGALTDFRARFGSADLYFADGSSFLETMEMITNDPGDEDAIGYATANVDDRVKAELRRIHYWQTH